MYVYINMKFLLILHFWRYMKGVYFHFSTPTTVSLYKTTPLSPHMQIQALQFNLTPRNKVAFMSYQSSPRY